MSAKGTLSDSLVETIKNKLLDGACDAVDSVVQLSKHADSEKLRFDASKFIIEVALRPGSKEGAGRDPWQGLLDALNEDM